MPDKKLIQLVMETSLEDHEVEEFFEHLLETDVRSHLSADEAIRLRSVEGGYDESMGEGL